MNRSSLFYWLLIGGLFVTQLLILSFYGASLGVWAAWAVSNLFAVLFCAYFVVVKGEAMDRPLSRSDKIFQGVIFFISSALIITGIFSKFLVLMVIGFMVIPLAHRWRERWLAQQEKLSDGEVE